MQILKVYEPISTPTITGFIFEGYYTLMIRYEILDNSIEVSGKNYERVLFVGNRQGLK